MNNTKIWRAAGRAIKRSVFFQQNRDFGLADADNYQLLYVLGKGKDPDAGQVIAVAGLYDSHFLFHPFTGEKPCELWDFTFEKDLFGFLGDRYRIIGISPSCHLDIWLALGSGEDGCRPAGLAEYLDYCKKHQVTKEKIVSATGVDGVPDLFAL